MVFLFLVKVGECVNSSYLKLSLLRKTKNKPNHLLPWFYRYYWEPLGSTTLVGWDAGGMKGFQSYVGVFRKTQLR